MTNRNIIVLFFFLLILGEASFAQSKDSKPLATILPILEKQFDVVFTFADEKIEGVFVSMPYKKLCLDDYILEIEKQTNLNFKKLNSRYIAIKINANYIKICGYVVDKSTKKSLVGAIVSSASNYAVSDENGWFSIVVNKKKYSNIAINHTGYKSFFLKQYSNGSKSLIYELIPDIQMLREIVVNYIAKGIDKLPDGATQMNIQNLEVLPGLSEPDVLQSVLVLPGVHSVNETVSNINIRGGTNDQNLLLWDGVKMYQTGHFFGLVSAFNSHLIHKTRIIKNGSSAAFDEGVSGIIDMQQQDYSVSNRMISMGLNMMSADIIVKTPISENLSLIFGARHSINNILLTPTYKSYYKRAFENTGVLEEQKGGDLSVDNFHDFSFYDLSCKLFYDISNKDKVRISILNVNNNIEYEESALIRDTLYRKNSHLNQSSFLSTINYTRSWSRNHESKLSTFVSNYYLDGTNVSILDNEHHIQKNEVIDWGIKIDSKNRINKTFDLLSGYQFKEVGIRNQDNIRKPGYKRDAKDVLRINSFYTEAEFKELFSKLYLRTGLRINYFSKFNEFSLEPRIALNYKLNKYISFQALAEKKSQHTAQLIDYQTDFLGVEKRKWVLSNNQSIPLLRSKQFSVGMRYNNTNFLVSLEVYKKKVSGLITPSQGFQNQYQYAYSIGKYNTQGVELLVNKRYMEYNIWINYSLAKNDYNFFEFSPSTFPNNFDIRHSISLGSSYIKKNFELSAGFNYRTGKPYTKSSKEGINDRNEISYQYPNSSRLLDYIRLDISAKYSFNLKNIKGEMGVSVWNIINRKNVINVYYQQNDNKKIEKITQNALEFTPNFNLRLGF